MAVLLAAKEAVFKAMGKDWMGTEGFRKIHIIPAGGQSFCFRLKGDFSKLRLRRLNLYGSFKKNRDYVIANLPAVADAGRGRDQFI